MAGSPGTDTAAAPPRPAPGCALHILDDAGVVFSQASQDIFAFNTSATYIWCQMEEGLAPDAIARAYAETFACTGAEARDHVDQALASWTGLGLLAGTAPAAADPPARRSRFDPDSVPPHREPAVVAQRRYRVARTAVRIRFTAADQEACVHPLLAHLESDDPAGDETVIDVVALGDGTMALYRDGAAAMDCPRMGLLAHKVKGLVWYCAVMGADYLFDFHAGVVGAGDRCLLLPAAAGSGKSTLTAALCHAGMQYLSDEIALLEAGTFRARPMPLALCVKDTAWDLLAPLYPDLAGLPAHERMDGKIVKYLPPPVNADPVPAEGLPATAVIFPRYDPDGPTELRPLAKNEALRRLLAECIVVSTALDQDQVRGLVDWIGRADTFDLPTASLAESVRLVLRYCGRT
ncbi:MAG: hypothetical protein H6907_04355 [Hyphomicrobiales bacterium]|nr:hypothetical protein [Hyphomicrobiales bacterium]